MGRRFGWLWAAYAVSTFGTWLAFDAFSLIAILVLHAGPTQVSMLAAAGLAVGAAVAVPLGPWMEFRHKRPVLITMDLVRFAAILSIPTAFALGALTFAQLLAVSVIVAAADIAFKAASGAYLKVLLPGEQLLTANARFESTMWTATVLGPPLGGAAIGLLGPVTTVLANAVSFLLSALGIRAIGGTDPQPEPTTGPPLPSALGSPIFGEGDRRTMTRAGRGTSPCPQASIANHLSSSTTHTGPQPPWQADPRPAPKARGGLARTRRHDLLNGWRHILSHPALRPLFVNTVLVNGLIMATGPAMAVLMLGHLGFRPWQYGLAFGAPCVGGLIGARLSRPLVARFGQRRILRVGGTLRACWSIALAFVQPGTAGLVLVITAQFGLVASVGVFNPVLATFRLNHTPSERLARTLTAWSVTSSATIAALTALWGPLATLTSPRAAIAIAGVLLLATPLVLPRRAALSAPETPRPATTSRRRS